MEVEIETKNEKKEDENVHVRVHLLHLRKRTSDVTQNIVKVSFVTIAALLLENIDDNDADAIIAFACCVSNFIISFHFYSSSLDCSYGSYDQLIQWSEKILR
jgi:hypothetical protein